MLGAKNFKELMEKHEYSERESGDENNTAENISITNKPVFAIPALPKHFSEKSMMGSPIAGSKGVCSESKSNIENSCFYPERKSRPQLLNSKKRE